MAHDETPAPKGRRARTRSLRGSGLSMNAEGYFEWRRVDPRTGKRVSRSTGQETVERALREGAKFDEELARRAAGLDVLDAWRLELAPLLGRWIAALEGETSDEARARLEQYVSGALRDLRLTRAADLDAVGRIDDRLRALAKDRGLSRMTMRRRFQDPLKRFSAWLAGNRRHLPHDPLASWEPIKAKARKGTRRAAKPQEVARALLALDRLDEARQRVPQRLGYVLMLVAAPRPGALLSRNVSHVDRAFPRLDLGEGHANKRKGDAALDPVTLAELEAAIAGRGRGEPLVRAPGGARQDAARFLDVWQEAFAVALVDELWPSGEPCDLEDLVLVARAIRAGELRVSAGGNPLLVKDRSEEEALAARLGPIVDRLRDDVLERMRGIDCHGFRTTHRTWSEAAGVPPVLADQQLGHVEREGGAQVLELLAGSTTGRRHYLDRSMFDGRRSAQAVRAMLDEAMAALMGEGRSALLAPKMAPMTSRGS